MIEISAERRNFDHVPRTGASGDTNATTLREVAIMSP